MDCKVLMTGFFLVKQSLKRLVNNSVKKLDVQKSIF